MRRSRQTPPNEIKIGLLAVSLEIGKSWASDNLRSHDTPISQALNSRAR